MTILKQNLGDVVSTKKLSLQGEKKIFDVYRVPLGLLRYNKKNGRIATYVSQYIDERKEFPNDIHKFNEIIEGYIGASNLDALKKTKANIKLLGQTEPAVVLDNGIVIDGNRRFTSLRQLSKEGAGAEFNYLEAVVLDSTKYTDKDIKRLELNLQHAVESRVDYNPIDRLVDIYRDLIENGGNFTPEEYRRETLQPLQKVKDEMAIANLMVEYLIFIGQPNKFFIARSEKIDGPLREIYKILKSNKVGEDRLDDIKEYLFLNIKSLDGDITRRIRELKAVFEDKTISQKLLDDIEESEILDDAVDFYTKNVGKASIGLDKEISDKVVQLTEEAVDRKKLQSAKDRPIGLLDKSYKTLKEIDSDAVIRMDEAAQTNFYNLLKGMSEVITQLENLNAK